MTPFNLMFWGSLNPDTSAILRQVSLSPLDVLFTVFLILGVPLIVGLTLSHLFPSLAEKVRKPFKIFALIFFVAIVGIALERRLRCATRRRLRPSLETDGCRRGVGTR